MPVRAKAWRGPKSSAPRHVDSASRAAGNRQATRALHTGTKLWRRIRADVLLEELYRCRTCGQYADQVDHIDGDSHNNTRDNLQALCLRCHSRKTWKEQHHGRTSL